MRGSQTEQKGPQFPHLDFVHWRQKLLELFAPKSGWRSGGWFRRVCRVRAVGQNIPNVCPRI